ncbi:MAG: PD-(D/E)XK nuclease family protein, partial [bacterium]
SVFRERWDIDLLLVSQSNKHVFVIENKIDAAEHGDQLERYAQRIDKEYPPADGYKRVFVFLTLDGSAPSRERWLTATHTMVVQQLETLLEKQGSQLPSAAKMVTEHYIDLFRRRIMGNSDIENLCQEIYRQHGEALNLLYEHKPDRLSEAMTYVSEFIQERGVDDGFVLDGGGKTSCRFFAQSWLQHPLQQSGSWGKNNCVLMFEFLTHKREGYGSGHGSIVLNLYIGPGNQGFRQQLFNLFQPASGFRKPEGVRKVKTELTDKFTAVLQFGEFVVLKEEIVESEWENELAKKLSAFCQSDWPVVLEALAPVMEKSG